MKVSTVQELALSKLTDEWQNTGNTNSPLRTLESLVTKGLAEVDRSSPHSRDWPEIYRYFRLKQEPKQ